MTVAQQVAGRKAKRVGHEKEAFVCAWLNENYGGDHKVDGKPNTKQDITSSLNTYSLKSVSKNHTQCHLTSTARWVEFFQLDKDMKLWLSLFFGTPGKDVSHGQSSQHRLTATQIPQRLNDYAVNWFNTNRLHVFDVIVAQGMSNTPVNVLIWYDKPTGNITLHNISDLRELVKTGRWVMRDTTLHFITKDGKKLFHVQMKGSGKKYTSGYHGMMFHIYKCF